MSQRSFQSKGCFISLFKKTLDLNDDASVSFWTYLCIVISVEPGSSWGVSCCGFFTVFDSWCDEEQPDSCSLRRMWWMETVCTTKSGDVRHLKDLYYARAFKEEEEQEASCCFYKLFSGFNLLWMVNINSTKKKQKKRSSVLHIWIKPADCFMFLKLTSLWRRC